MECHRQEHLVGYTGGGLGANINPTPFTDNGALPASEPTYTLPAIEVGSQSGYAPVFYPYSTGMEFLNSAHGQFTGNFQQINDPTKYKSGFVLEGTGLLYPGEPPTDPAGGGCTKCHDVHQSTVAAVNAAAPFKKDCPTCHIEGSPERIAKITHPKGTGTPLGDLSNIAASCHKCHMPKPNNGEGRSSHIWRVNTDASYATFPTQEEWNAGQKTAYTSPTASYTNAVWLDIQLVCGQCHTSSAGQADGVPQFLKEEVAEAAKGMHTGLTTGNCMVCHNKTRGSYAAIVQGTNHHSGACTICHGTTTYPLHQKVVVDCTACHPATFGASPNGPSLLHHVIATGSTCGACHPFPGVRPLNADGTVKTCANCHTWT